MDFHTVDLNHAGIAGAIAAYVVPDPAPLIVDPGPAASLPALEAGLEAVGLRLTDIATVALTHVHLDHAGATGTILGGNPEARVYVHADGAPHLIDPERLVNSTRRTFGERSDELWGHTEPVDPDRIDVWTDGESRGPLGLDVLPSPGHIAHHLAYRRTADGTLFAGDAMGIVLHPDRPSHPPTPPPSLDFSAWYDTLQGWEGMDVPRFAATHFGVYDDFASRRAELLQALHDLEARVTAELAAGTDGSEAYGAEVVARMSDNGADRRVVEYFTTFPASTEWHGAAFHLKRRGR